MQVRPHQAEPASRSPRSSPTTQPQVRPPEPSRPRSRSRSLAAALFLAAPFATGCAIERSQPGVWISTTPPGARLFVDGLDSGFLTPAAVDLPGGGSHRLDVRLAGYRTASRIVVPSSPVRTIPWTSGYIGPTSFWFPLFLSVPELLVPFRMDDGFSPERLHILLELDDRP